jgi:hypothetical protein
MSRAGGYLRVSDWFVTGRWCLEEGCWFASGVLSVASGPWRAADGLRTRRFARLGACRRGSRPNLRQARSAVIAHRRRWRAGERRCEGVESGVAS